MNNTVGRNGERQSSPKEAERCPTIAVHTKSEKQALESLGREPRKKTRAGVGDDT